ncbi:hypothetical protein F0L74_09945 [Chitinophaga agrisoli]|uniref:Uncharacterized protein n=1 Tax=Chitinophaga agrisoli TaxID=2607653 RepID=A0A5B2VVW8_9BACT|nr:hypothetical protein [Chitinophaga agrisoli]KAA2242840.1 hypothetical protein F0L74_09945 [Chitinophaga agrisoli]
MQKGSIVICLMDGTWEYVETKETSTGPRYGDQTVVSGFQGDGLYLEFEEYPALCSDGLPNSWDRTYFREVQPPMTVQIEDIISEPQTV